eukprot:1382396-Pyramimonas_sp.AAC.1
MNKWQSGTPRELWCSGEVEYYGVVKCASAGLEIKAVLTYSTLSAILSVRATPARRLQSPVGKKGSGEMGRDEVGQHRLQET